jgi:transposase
VRAAEEGARTMARYKPYDYNQAMMVPVSLNDQLQEGTLEHTIHYVVDRLDLSAFDKERINDDTGRPGYDPRVLLKVVLLGYARGLLSSRKLEAACRDNILFLALCCGQRPDHSTIAQFVSGIGAERIASLFSQVLLVCHEEGLLGGTHFAIDGYKLSSNAAKDSSGTIEDLEKKEKKLRELIRRSVREHRQNDRGGPGSSPHPGKRIEKLQRQADRIERFVSRNKPRIGRTGNEVQSNITDNESAKMKSSHGIVQGYNANAMVDAKHQVIVHAQAFGEGDDGAAAAPMLEGAKANLAAAGCELEGAVVTADTGYFSNRNLEAFEEAQVDAYVPDPKFRQRDPRFADSKRFRRPTDRHKQQYKSKRRHFGPKDFKFDERTHRLICPAGKRLYGTGREAGNAQGYLVSHYKAARTACLKCPLRERCLKNPDSGNPRQVRLFHGRVTETLTSRMKDKIDTPQGRATYSRRLAIVEPVFANIAAQKGMNRSTLRGQKKVNIQFRLYCIVHNLGKIGKYGTGPN